MPARRCRARADDLADRDPAELGIEEPTALTASPESFAQARDRYRARLRQQLLAQYGLEPDDDYGNEIVAETGVDVDDHFGSDRLARLADGPESYQDVRHEFRAAQYARIQAETDEHLSEPELEAAYQDQLSDIRQQLRDETREGLFSGDLPAELESPASALVEVIVDAHTDDDLAYGDFMTTYGTV